MKVNVFDKYLTMKDREGYPELSEELLAKLDEMLTMNGVSHSFTLPLDADMKKDPEAVLNVFFNSEDDMTFSLVYALFCKVYRKIEDEKLAECLGKIAAKYTHE